MIDQIGASVKNNERHEKVPGDGYGPDSGQVSIRLKMAASTARGPILLLDFLFGYSLSYIILTWMTVLDTRNKNARRDFSRWAGPSS